MGGGANIVKNGPFLIGQFTVFMSIFSMFVVVNFVANTATRNHSTQMSELLYCKPFNPVSYQLGRFLGSFSVAATAFGMVPLGLMFGSLMPWVDTARLGPTNLSYYFTSFTYLALPTLFAFSCIFYSVALRFKSMLGAYLAAVAVLILFEISSSVFDIPEYRYISSLLDPFAITTFAEVTRYWTVIEKNNLTLSLGGILLQNRLLWIGIGFAVMILFGRFFKALLFVASASKGQQPNHHTEESDTAPIDLHGIAYRGSGISRWQPFVTRTLFEIKHVIISPAFYVLVLIALVEFIVLLNEPRGMFGTAIWPVTQIMVEVIQQAMGALVLVVIIYYSAEIVWRERSSDIGDIVDSMPLANLSFWLSKLVAMCTIVFVLLSLGILVTITHQLASDYHVIELGQYFISLFYFTALPWVMLVILAFFLQVMSPNKYVGMLLFVIYILSRLMMESLGLSHHLLRFSQSPALPYSDLNGYGLTWLSHSWYMLYWGALSLALSVITYGLWHRGTEQRLTERLKKLSYQIGKSGKVILACTVVVFITSGSVIYYNTSVLNEHASSKRVIEIQAEYENTYAQYTDAPIPHLNKVNARIDIHPEQRRIVAAADIVVINKNTQPIERFLVSMPEYVSPDLIVEIEGGKLGERHGVFNTYWFEFSQPLQPGEQRSGRFRVTRENHGFVENDHDLQVVQNGTFINNIQLFPRFGYLTEYELTDKNERRRHNLPPPRRANKLEDERYYQQTAIGTASGFIDFEATVSTTLDQVAIAPGYLQREWKTSNRRYFHYKMDAPMENFYAFLSARLDVAKDEYKGIMIEVYYHPDHGMNVQRMITSIKDSIDYYTSNFGPYQHRQARIIEFPGYQEFAQSFANTIPYSERIGFIYDLRDSDETDSVYFVTAHEMAHQWWGGQVDSANVQGNAVIIETLAHYSALMVTEKKYGLAKSRHILKYELDRYLQGRSRETVEELPLMKAENQAYIHYRKGVVVMASLRDLLGERRLNAALKAFLNEFKFNSAPYPTSVDLKKHIEQGASIAEREFIDSVFAEITLYDLKATQISSKPLSTGDYEITFSVEAKRFTADGQGSETEVEFAQLIDIGLFSKNPDEITSDSSILYLKKHMIHTGTNVITLVVPELPGFAGIDPFVTLIDRDSEDNVVGL